MKRKRLTRKQKIELSKKHDSDWRKRVVAKKLVKEFNER